MTRLNKNKLKLQEIAMTVLNNCEQLGEMYFEILRKHTKDIGEVSASVDQLGGYRGFELPNIRLSCLWDDYSVENIRRNSKYGIWFEEIHPHDSTLKRSFMQLMKKIGLSRDFFVRIKDDAIFYVYHDDCGDVMYGKELICGDIGATCFHRHLSLREGNSGDIHYGYNKFYPRFIKKKGIFYRVSDVAHGGNPTHLEELK